MKCPECKNELFPVLQDRSSPLNYEQFESVRAGDYYCENCTGSRGNSGYRYFWKKELIKQNPSRRWRRIIPFTVRCAVLSIFVEADI